MLFLYLVMGLPTTLWSGGVVNGDSGIPPYLPVPYLFPRVGHFFASTSVSLSSVVLPSRRLSVVLQVLVPSRWLPFVPHTFIISYPAPAFLFGFVGAVVSKWRAPAHTLTVVSSFRWGRGTFPYILEGLIQGQSSFLLMSLSLIPSANLECSSSLFVRHFNRNTVWNVDSRLIHGYCQVFRFLWGLQ
jgi:hypothetical protein